MDELFSSKQVESGCYEYEKIKVYMRNYGAEFGHELSKVISNKKIEKLKLKVLEDQQKIKSLKYLLFASWTLFALMYT